MWRRLAAIAALLVLTGLAAACGGDDGGNRLSRAAYARRADAICRTFRERTAKLGKVRTMAQLARVSDQSLPLFDDALHDLRKLKPPAAEQETADRWLAQLERIRGDIKELRDAARANDLARVQGVVPHADADNKRSNKLAKQLGMRACGSG